MASRDRDHATDSEPNLELPSLFGKRRKKPPVGAEPAPSPEASTRPLRPVAGAKRRPPSPPPRRGPELSYEAPREDPPAAVLTAPTPRPTRPARPTRPSLPTLPSLPGRLAAVVAGVAVALTGTALLWIFLQGCTAVRGVSSCGGFGLVGISITVAAQVVVGAALLTALRLAEPRSTAALGVGIAATVAMVLFYASTPAVAMAVVMLVLTPTAFVVAAGVTTAEPGNPD